MKQLVLQESALQNPSHTSGASDESGVGRHDVNSCYPLLGKLVGGCLLLSKLSTGTADLRMTVLGLAWRSMELGVHADGKTKHKFHHKLTLCPPGRDRETLCI